MIKQNKGIKISTILSNIILIILIIVCFNTYAKNNFNGFIKAVNKEENLTEFSRDKNVKYGRNKSYKIKNIELNDSTFYKEVELEPNTPYRLTCMVKTENVEPEAGTNSAGVVIGLLDTTEYSKALTGTNDWQEVEFKFNSKDRTKANISFRLGGNNGDCTGTAWFSDFKLEKGTSNQNGKWDIGCFVFKNLNVNIEGKQYKLEINAEDYDNVKLNMERYKDTCSDITQGKIDINYEIVEIDTPITTISYSEEHGYYVSYHDIEELIYETVVEKEYDHVFAVCRMESDDGKISIPIKDNWIGLGSMDMYGIGYSLIRINKRANSYTYKYGITNQAPEEVYVHEFLHTLERNSIENGYDIPALHDYEKYGYTEKKMYGLLDWYKDYASEKIQDKTTGQYIGLPEFAYTTQPPQTENFKYAVETELNKEPQNLFEEILTVFDAIKR